MVAFRSFCQTQKLISVFSTTEMQTVFNISQSTGGEQTVRPRLAASGAAPPFHP